ncbi:MAG: translation initiation factor [Candidatus Kapaibacterium sp.]|nr:MAG: translation initiation factor [Candidatus Kapabacteria bacterium]
MSKLSSFADLSALLPENYTSEKAPKAASKLGYDGKAQQVRIATEKRKNKTVTIISGFQSNPQELESLVANIKKQCGTGGRVLDNTLEIQGDHTSKIAAFLATKGFILETKDNRQQAKRKS